MGSMINFVYSAKSLDSGGPAIISGPLDYYLTYDELFDHMLDGMKLDLPKLWSGLGVDVQTLADYIEVVDCGAEEYEIKWFPLKPDGNLMIKVHCRGEKESITRTWSINEVLMTSEFLRIHPDPLRLEVS